MICKLFLLIALQFVLVYGRHNDLSEQIPYFVSPLRMCSNFGVPQALYRIQAKDQEGNDKSSKYTYYIQTGNYSRYFRLDGSAGWTLSMMENIPDGQKECYVTVLMFEKVKDGARVQLMSGIVFHINIEDCRPSPAATIIISIMVALFCGFFSIVSIVIIWIRKNVGPFTEHDCKHDGDLMTKPDSDPSSSDESKRESKTQWWDDFQDNKRDSTKSNSITRFGRSVSSACVPPDELTNDELSNSQNGGLIIPRKASVYDSNSWTGGIRNLSLVADQMEELYNAGCDLYADSVARDPLGDSNSSSQSRRVTKQKSQSLSAMMTNNGTALSSLSRRRRGNSAAGAISMSNPSNHPSLSTSVPMAVIPTVEEVEEISSPTLQTNNNQVVKGLPFDPQRVFVFDLGDSLNSTNFSELTVNESCPDDNKSQVMMPSGRRFNVERMVTTDGLINSGFEGDGATPEVSPEKKTPLVVVHRNNSETDFEAAGGQNSLSPPNGDCLTVDERNNPSLSSSMRSVQFNDITQLIQIPARSKGSDNGSDILNDF